MKSNFSSGKSSAAQLKAEPALDPDIDAAFLWLTESASAVHWSLGHVEGHGAGARLAPMVARWPRRPSH